MKKILFFALLISVLCISAFAAEPGFLLTPDFTAPIKYSTLYAAELTYGENYATITSTHDLNEGQTGDPHFVVNTELDPKYKWMKIRIMNHSQAVVFEMHFASEATGSKITAESCTHFPITAQDTEYKEYIFNISDHNAQKQGGKSYWEGKINQLRFDCMWIAEPSGQMPKGSSMDIDYIAFFETEEDAMAYDKAREKIDYSNVEWDKNSPHFIFDNAEEVSKWALHQASSELEMGNLKFIPNGNDPTIARQFETPFAAEEFHWFAYRYKAATESTVGGLFFTSDKVPNLTSKFYESFKLNPNGYWTDYILDLNNITNGTWEGTINSMRLDPVNDRVSFDTKIYINRLGFFRTKEEAFAFLAAGGTEDFSKSAQLNGDMFKAIIPGGTIADTLDERKFILQSENADNSSVVTYTDANGNKSIVALSYTNDYGYTSYVANKPGTYAIGANHKDYVDIAGHWGEGYINFVSDRALFGGTSPTEFSPEVTMTRGMFITVLGRMHGLDTSKYDGNTGYGDVPAGEYYAPYIQWAKAEGIMAGLSDVTFAPEDPITRATMAVVIKNYIDNSGFEFTAYSETEGFNDLTGLDEATINAINSVKNVGIINGKGAGKFDPNGVSTRAEVATVMERVIKAVLGVNVPVGTKSVEEINKERIDIGIWGFTSALATEKGMKQLYDLGANMIVSDSATASPASRDFMLNFADVHGMKIFVNDYYNIGLADDEKTTAFLQEKDPIKVAAAYAHHPSFAGHHIIDEPGSDYFKNLGRVIDNYETKFPGKTAFVNLLPMYANAPQLKYGAGAYAIDYYDADPDLYRKYCQEWFTTNNSDYICTDIYPLNWVGTSKTTYRDYIESINQIATVAREENKEFWCCIQTYGWQADKRTPTEAEYRWQCYCLLSFGCTGILLWQYLSTNPVYPSLIDSTTLNETDAYYDCQTVMHEMKAISDIFVQYRNLGAFTHNAVKNYQKMTGEYKNFDTIKSITSDQSLLIGCFEKKDGSGATAFTIVNMEEFEGELTAKAVIQLDPAKKVTIYNHGVATPVENNGSVTIDLASGDGFFVTVE